MRKTLYKNLCAQCALISKVRRHKNSNSPAAGRVRLSINRSISISLLHAKSVSRREEVCGNIDNCLIFCLKTDLNNLSNPSETLINTSGSCRDRTYDQRIKSPLLYRLS